MHKKSHLQHVGIIMDGNRRWARAQGLDSIEGHAEGTKRVRPIVEQAIKAGVSHISFFTLSEDNLLRDPREVDALMNIFRDFFASSDMNDLMENGVKVDALGNYQRLPKDIVKMVDDLEERTKDNKGIQAHFALCYDGASEILHAAQGLVNKGIKKVDKKSFENELYSSGDVPDLDLVIRTGGEYRLSGFLLWQAKYAELRFIKTFWPSYTPKHFDRDIVWYWERERRFGK